MTKIKICGIKTLPAALAAIEAGADYLGFNFYSKSVRFIEKETCAEITSVLRRKHPQIKLVGVFVNSPVEEIEATLTVCHLDLAQLHGDEPPEMVASFNGKAFKAIRLSTSISVDKSVHPFSSVDPSVDPSVGESVHPFSSVDKSVGESVHPFSSVDKSVEYPALLVDAAVKGIYGGSGVTTDWSAAAEMAKHYPLLLAGGLTPENVADAVRQVRPWGVDVASGVESAPGVKDAGKMKAFVQAVLNRQNQA